MLFGFGVSVAQRQIQPRLVLDHLLEIGASWHKNQRNALMYYPGYKKNAAYNYGYFQPYYMPAGDQQTRGLYLQDSMTSRPDQAQA